MKLYDIMLRVAELISDVYDGTATGGSTSTLIDTNMGAQAEQYSGGTCWITSGSAVGDILTVKQSSEVKLTFVETASAGIAAGNTYSVAPPVFPKKLIKQAVNWTLKNIKVPTSNKALTISAGVITLPTGVSDICQVIVGGVRMTHWQEINGTIVFDNASTTGSLELKYMAQHAEVDEDDEINPAVNLVYLLWASAAYLWRNYVQRVKRDDTTAIDMLNEALSEAARYKPAKVLSKDPRLGGV